MSVQDPRWNQVAQIIGEMDGEHIRFRVQGQSMMPSLQPGDEVVVQRVSPDTLCPGDLVLVRDEGRFLLHRFLGVRRRGGQRYLLTGGDHLRCADPPVAEAALLGRAVRAYRQGQPLPLAEGRWRAWRHRARITFWAVARLLRSLWPRRTRHAVLLLLLTLALILAAPIARASVTLVSFEAAWQGDAIRVTWETASEVDNMGFYVLRGAQDEPSAYARVTGLIPGEGDLVGAFYEWLDQDATQGVTYFYKLEDISASGGSTLWGPLTVEPTGPPPTDTPTPTPQPSDTPIPTDTPLPTHTPMPTPTPTPTFTATPQPSPTPTPTFTPRPTATPQPSATPKPAATKPNASPTPTSSPTASPEPSPTPQPTAAPLTEAAPSEPAPTATATPQPSPTPQPTATATAVEVALRPQPEAQEPAEPPADESPTSVERQRNLVLLIIGVVVAGGLLLVAVALVLFALYRWGFLRLG